MGAEYRQRYEDHLLRITVLAATHQITVVFAAMAADQWAAAGITKKGAVQTAAEGIALPLQQLVQAIAIAVSYTHLTLPTIHVECRSRWSQYH